MRSISAKSNEGDTFIFFGALAGAGLLRPVSVLEGPLSMTIRSNPWCSTNFRVKVLCYAQPWAPSPACDVIKGAQGRGATGSAPRLSNSGRKPEPSYNNPVLAAFDIEVDRKSKFQALLLAIATVCRTIANARLRSELT